MDFPENRLSRLRANSSLRKLVQETRLTPSQLIMPLFVHHGTGVEREIPSMPGQFQYSLDKLADVARRVRDAGILAVLLFGIPEHKDAAGSDSWSDQGIIQQALRALKQAVPELILITDVCFCEYTGHGHCGVLEERHGQMVLDHAATRQNLARQALSHAAAGSDMLAPSGMIDGMVRAIREVLDRNDFGHLPILSYAVKYASAFYGPFRDAAGGAPSFGDRRSHQMNPANGREALREAEADLAEGADILMVKPALAYLDIIRRLRDRFDVPLAAYNVSGEYSMLKAAAQRGWLDEKAATLEVLMSIRRAGADLIITYFAEQAAKWL